MRTNRHGFTLIELLVTFAIIAMLASLLIPAVQASREAARRTACLSNLRQLTLAAQQYHSAYNQFPPGLKQKLVRWSPRYRGTSLFTYLLPHLEQGKILRQWDYHSPLKNTEGGAQALSATVLSVLVCPSDRIPENPIIVANRHFGVTSYGGNGGVRSYDASRATLDGIFHTTGSASEPTARQRPVRAAMVTDGASRTVLFGERSHVDPNLESFAEVYWAESLKYLGRWAAVGGRKRIGDVTMSALVPINYRIPFNYSGRSQAGARMTTRLEFQPYEERRKCAFGSNHVGGANFALADGSARFFRDSLPLSVLRAMCTRNGGDVVSR